MYYISILAGIILIVVGIVGLMKNPSGDSTKSELTNKLASVSTSNNEKPINVTFNIIQQKSDVNGDHLYDNWRNNPSETNVIQKEKEPNLSLKDKGNLFEGYVADCFGNRSLFELLKWNQGVTSPGGVHATEDENPDFHVKQLLREDYSVDYFVEAKYNSRWNKEDKIKLNEYQLIRYRKHGRLQHRKVFMAIGVGGSPDNPAEFYLVPLDSIKSDQIAKNEILQFKIDKPHSQFSTVVKNYFFKHVFPSAKK